MLNNPLIKTFLDNPITVYQIMVLPYYYAEINDIEGFQVGYKVDAISQKDLTGDENGKFPSKFYVLARNYFSDPFCINIDEANLGFPVYFAYSSAGNWLFDKISPDLKTFRENLEAINSKVESVYDCMKYLEDNQDIENKFWAEVYEVVTSSYDDD